ncbi:uncharacterized protein LOC133440608 [Cololabis saira]|uniref:uncharacterized protein LOC133440608 n=1 Tax=Cololabis saira TaxID=129043 RepID=UPI002AD3EAEE|nr:uncharacterized protein LOC133440608 [Cololabis saira]
MDLVVLVALSSWLAPALGSGFGREVFASAADDGKDYDSAFQYDYESLRIGGLIFAVLLFVLGIALIVTRKCSCSKSDKSRSRTPDVESSGQKENLRSAEFTLKALNSPPCCAIRLLHSHTGIHHNPATCYISRKSLHHPCSAAMATTEAMFQDQSDFEYDYETLRTTGVILAVIMFVAGILIALIPTLLEPQFQRQRFLLQLYRNCNMLERKKDVITGFGSINKHQL